MPRCQEKSGKNFDDDDGGSGGDGGGVIRRITGMPGRVKRNHPLQPLIAASQEGRGEGQFSH